MTTRVLVMGLGRSGQAAARLAARDGCEVVGVDLRPDLPPIEGVRLELGPHRRQTFLEADRIVVSPGIPATQPDLGAAVAAGIEVIGELGFAAEHLKQPTVAITGTNGKSTVTWFTGQLLRAAGFQPFVGGNLGNPLSEAALSDEPYDVLAVEVSSYQLERPGGFSPRSGVILNLTPDHLARHGDLDGYARAKLRLFDRMTAADLAILPVGDQRLARLAPDRGTRAWVGDLPGVRREGDTIRVSVPTHGLDATFDLAGFAIPGSHNQDNAAVAALLALSVGAAADRVASALPRLEPLAHRMEVVGTARDVVWINDSKATNVDATRVGLSGLDRRAVVLLGGQAKGRGFAELAPLLVRHRAVLCFGGSGPEIAEELRAEGLSVEVVGTLADAVTRAATLARPADAVLLSPGCASFDAFDDFEHRGRVFRALVQEVLR